MSCFWDSILNKIKYEDYLKILNFNGKPSPKEFIELLKSNNKKTENIIWNTKILSEKQSTNESPNSLRFFDIIKDSSNPPISIGSNPTI